MTTTLRDDRPAKASRSSRGFCEGGHGQSYEMWCQQAGSLVTATGGNNALVEFCAG